MNLIRLFRDDLLVRNWKEKKIHLNDWGNDYFSLHNRKHVFIVSHQTYSDPMFDSFVTVSWNETNIASTLFSCHYMLLHTGSSNVSIYFCFFPSCKVYRFGLLLMHPEQLLQECSVHFEQPKSISSKCDRLSLGVTWVGIGSGNNTSEGQSTLDVLEVKPERPDWEWIHGQKLWLELTRREASMKRRFVDVV